MHLNKIIIAVQKKTRGPARKHQDFFIRRRRRQHFESTRTLLPETGSRRRISNSAAAVGTFGALTFPKNQRPSAHLTRIGGGGALLAGAGPSDLPRALPAIKFCPYALFGTTGELVYLPS